MQLKVSAVCDPGKLREINEDNLFINGSFLPELHVATYSVTKRYSTLFKPLFCVFDGMGGYDAGEKASYLAAAVTEKLFRSTSHLSRSKQLLPDICTQANLTLCDEMLKGNIERLGTTAAMLLFSGKQYFLCNIGDSPIFLLRNDSLLEISKEHTERRLYEAIMGQKSDPGKKFRLTQNIGIFPDELVLEPYFSQGQLMEKDTFLICSDGITDMLDTMQIKYILQQKNVAAAAQELLCRALDAGGKDNITAIVIRCGR